MKMDLENVIRNVAIELLTDAAIKLPSEIKDALRKSMEKETNKTAKKQLETILMNIDLAEKTGTPMCQDTGIIMFYLKAGNRFPILDKIPHILEDATKKATASIPLRPNAVDPFTRKNSGTNTGEYIPWIDWEIVDGEDLELTAAPKGYGSENMCKLKMLTPGDGIKGLKKFVLDTVIEAGAKPCPPIILGVGVGGGADSVMKLARKGALRPLSKRHEKTEIANLEKELASILNQTGIGPMGLGGKTTVLGVNIEYAYTHTAGMPIGVVIQCWAARKASAKISFNGQVKYLTHEER
jgi:fumarate hydratase subunit alpha